MTKKNVFILSIVTLAMVILYAFTFTSGRIVTGHVLDKTGIPLTGASILVKGTNIGTLADLNGKFSLEIPNDKHTLIVSYNGYTTKEVDLSKTLTVQILLEASELSEIIEIPEFERDEDAVLLSVGDINGVAPKENKKVMLRGASTLSYTSNMAFPNAHYDQKFQNREGYNTFTENHFTTPLDRPLSTFGIDVDRASYSNIRRMINNGYKPVVDAVRIEDVRKEIVENDIYSDLEIADDDMIPQSITENAISSPSPKESNPASMIQIKRGDLNTTTPEIEETKALYDGFEEPTQRPVVEQAKSEPDAEQEIAAAKETDSRRMKTGSKMMSNSNRNLDIDPYLIEGRISTLGKALSGSNIRAKNNKVSTLSDKRGNFSLEINGEDTLLISHPGYTSETIYVDKFYKKDLGLSQEAAIEKKTVLDVPLSPLIEPEIGYNRFEKYIRARLDSKELVVLDSITGHVVLEFDIDQQGEPANFKVIKSLCEECDREAIRLIREGGKWKYDPAKPINTVRYSIEFDN